MLTTVLILGKRVQINIFQIKLPRTLITFTRIFSRRMNHAATNREQKVIQVPMTDK